MRVALEDIEVKVWRSHIKIPVIFLMPALTLLSLYVILYFGANSSLALQTIGEQVGLILNGDVSAQELVIDPSLRGVHLYNGRLAERGSEQAIVTVDEAHLRLSLVGLLSKHVRVTQAQAIHPKVHMEMDEAGELNLLRALGLYIPEDPNDPGGEMPILLTFEDVDLVRGEFFMRIDGIFEVEIPEVNIHGNKLHIDKDTLLIDVERARTPRGKLRFYNELFGFPEGAGDWRFTVDRFEIDRWLWSNSGFTVDRFSGDVEGYQVEASGQMGFPEEGDDVMTWRGKGNFSAPLWSSLIHYFVGETLHFSIPSFAVEGEGTINWVESRGKVYADYIDGAGIKLTELTADVAIHDQLVEINDADFSLYGGTGHVDQAFFDMFELAYSGALSVERVDLAGLIWDFFEIEAEYMRGETTGSFTFDGKMPSDLEYRPEKDTLYAHVTDRWIDLTLTSPLVIERANQEILPTRRITIEQGGQVWVDQDRAAVPMARMWLDDRDVFDLEDFVVNYDKMIYEPYFNRWGGHVVGRFASLTPYLRFYDIDGVTTGPMRFDMVGKGDLMAPDVKGSFVLRDMALGEDFVAQEVSSRLVIDGGDVRVDDLVMKTAAGSAKVDGRIDLMRRTAEPDPYWEFIVYKIKNDARLSFDMSAEEFDLTAFSPWVPKSLGLRGVATIEAQARGRLDAMWVCGEANASRLSLYGEPFSEVSFKGEYRDAGVKPSCEPGVELAAEPVASVTLSEAHVAHAQAGNLYAKGSYYLDDRLDATIATRDFRPGLLTALAPYGLRGDFEAALDVGGTLGAPELSGSVRGKALGMKTLELGDMALTMDTLSQQIDDDTEERILYVSGALLPWVKLAAEVPLDTSGDAAARAPIYGRMEMERLDLLELFTRGNLATLLVEDELTQKMITAQLRQLEQALLSGVVEVFVPADGRGVTVVADLPSVRLGPPRLGLENRDPIVLSYVSDNVLGEDRLSVESLTLGREGRFLEVSGGFTPQDSFVDLKLDGAFDLGLIMALKRIVPGVIPEELVDVSGYLDVDATFRGTLEKLLTEGQVRWHPSTFALRSLSEPVVIRGGVVNFSQQALTVPESEPLSGAILGGAFAIHGDVAIEELTPKDFSLSLWTHNISYAVPEVANVTLDTDLRFTGRDPLDVSTWKVSGAVEILDGLFYQNISVLERELTGRVLGAFNRKTEVYEASIFDELPELGQMQLDVALRARDGFKLQNEIDSFGLDLEFRIDLVLSETIEELAITGDVDVIDGSVLFQGQKFTVRTGTVRFSGDPGQPYIDIVAVSNIRNACRSSSLQNQFTGALALNGAVTTSAETQDEIYQISLNVRGNSNNLNITYNATPYADQRDIISLILTGCTVDLLTASSASQPTLETLLGPLIGRLEREIQEVVSVEEFNITPGVNRTQVKISDDLTRRLSWKFQLDKAFNDANSTGQSAQLEYQLTERWAAVFVESSYSDLNTASRFQLDLKLKYRLPLD